MIKSTIKSDSSDDNIFIMEGITEGPIKKVELCIKYIDGDDELEWSLGTFISDHEGKLLPEYEIENRFNKLCNSIRRTLSVEVKNKIYGRSVKPGEKNDFYEIYFKQP